MSGFLTCPNTTCFMSSHGVLASVRKNLRGQSRAHQSQEQEAAQQSLRQLGTHVCGWLAQAGGPKARNQWM